MKHHKKEAARWLKDHWPIIVKVAKVLVKRWSLTHEEIMKIVEESAPEASQLAA